MRAGWREGENERRYVKMEGRKVLNGDDEKQEGREAERRLGE